LRKKADADDAEAQYELACLYMKGEGVPRDCGEAYYCYLRARDSGNAAIVSNVTTACNELNELLANDERSRLAEKRAQEYRAAIGLLRKFRRNPDILLDRILGEK